MYYFTSDTHFSHKNIIEYCRRPFKSVEEMDSELIRRWNARVKPEDHVFHLGDFCMGKRDVLPRYRSALNGRITLILGNHDRSASAMLAAGFDEVMEKAVITLLVQASTCTLFLQHHPQAKRKWLHADYHFCGHVHEKWARQGKIINVGVDVQGFEPKTADELLLTPNLPPKPSL